MVTVGQADFSSSPDRLSCKVWDIFVISARYFADIRDTQYYWYTDLSSVGLKKIRIPIYVLVVPVHLETFVRFRICPRKIARN